MADLNILVVNSKGGCGKTTVATNLATAYANADVKVGLYDCDPQASARHWAESRSDELSPIDLRFCPEPKNIEPANTQHYDVCVYDSAPGISTKPALQSNFEALLKLSDVIVVPMLSSAWDIQAGGAFHHAADDPARVASTASTHCRSQQSRQRQPNQPTATAAFFELFQRACCGSVS